MDWMIISVIIVATTTVSRALLMSAHAFQQSSNCMLATGLSVGRHLITAAKRVGYS